MAKLVSNVYGDALFELAVESGKTDSYLKEAKELLAVLKDNDDLNRLMNHPKIVKEEKIKTIEKIFKGQISDELLGLMVQLITKDHYNETTKVLEYVIEKIKEHLYIGTAYVTTVMELRDEQKKAVEKRLLETTSYKSFEIIYNIDPSLIGGMVIRIKDRVVDSSIKTKLNGLTSELTKIQLKVGECTP